MVFYDWSSMIGFLAWSKITHKIIPKEINGTNHNGTNHNGWQHWLRIRFQIEDNLERICSYLLTISAFSRKVQQGWKLIVLIVRTIGGLTFWHPRWHSKYRQLFQSINESTEHESWKFIFQIWFTESTGISLGVCLFRTFGFGLQKRNAKSVFGS